jgi:NUMOD3 motif
VYICNCGREFEKQKSLNSHARFCQLYLKKIKTSIYKIDEHLYRCECRREFDNHQSLNSHFSFCLIHREGKPISHRNICKGIMNGWDNFSKEDINDIRKKSAKTYSIRLNSGEIINPFKNKKHTKESKEKISSSNGGRNNGFVKTKYYDVFCPYENKDVKVQGTWELKYVKFLNDNNIKWTRTRKINLKYKLFEDDYWHTYFPDFYLIDKNEYIEIKGFWWKSKDGRVDDKRKMDKVIEYNSDKKITIITDIENL